MVEKGDPALEQASNQIGQVAGLRGLGWGTLARGFYDPNEALVEAILRGEMHADLRKASGWLDTDVERFESGLTTLQEWAAEAAGRDPAAVLQDLKVEYARLFIGAPGPMEAPPYESLYRDRDPGGALLVNGPSTLAVERAYAAHGLRRASGHRDLLDHVATELEFMHFLCTKEQEAWEHGETEAAKTLRNAQRQFFDEHLSQWLPEFCDRLGEAANGGVYGALGELLKESLAVENGSDYAHGTLRGVFGGGST